MHIGDAARLFRVEGPTGVRLKLSDLERAPEVALELARAFDPGVLVRDWGRRSKRLCCVQIEKRMLFISLR